MSVLLLSAFAVLANAQPVFSWTWKDRATPTNRWRHAAAFDPVRKVMVVFGGDTGETDVWEFNCQNDSWTSYRRPNAATPWPAARGRHTMAYDAARGRVVMAGGEFNSVVYKDAWTWDTVNHVWAAIADLPEPRSGHACVYDSARGRLLLYGGTTLSASSNSRSLLSWNGTSWVILSTLNQPGDQIGHAMAFDSNRGRAVLVVSGRNGTVSAPVWECFWTGSAYNWQQMSFNMDSPQLGRNPAMTFDSARNVCVLTEGDGVTNTQTWIYPDSSVSGTEWLLKVGKVDGPDNLTEATLIFDSFKSRAIHMGGVSGGQAPRRSMLSWNGTKWSVLNADQGPYPVTYPAMAFDPVSGTALFTGGDNLDIYDARTSRSDAFSWNGVGWTSVSRTPDSFPAMGSHSMTSDPVRKSILIYGGSAVGNSDSPRARLFECVFSTTTGKWSTNERSVPLEAPALWGHASAYDSSAQSTILFGGVTTGSFATADTWAISSVDLSWHKLGDGPSERYQSAMAFDPSRGVTVLFGGVDDTGDLSDTWELRQGQWTRIATPHAPTARDLHVMFYEPSRHRVFLAGGSDDNANLLTDLWMYDGSDWTRVGTTGEVPPRFAFGAAFDPVRHELVTCAGATVAASPVYSTSQTWTLAFPCLADLNGDETVDLLDFFDWFNYWDASDPRADLNQDGQVDLLDFFSFFNAFDASC